MSNVFDSLTPGERRDLTIDSAIRLVDSFPAHDLIEALVDSDPLVAMKVHDAERSLLALRKALAALVPSPVDYHNPEDWL
jgi:hypothetical protein